MDNITHSIIGIIAAESVVKIRKVDRRPLWIASVLANNLPDIDVPITRIFVPGELPSLLHHRGHSHTLLLAPLLSFLLLGLLKYFWKKKALPWKEIALLAFLGPILHILADSMNTYGVHPFWPLDNHWRYGDMLFILEPWLWIAMIPPIFRLTENIMGKRLLAVLFLGLMAATWVHPLAPKIFALILTIFAFFIIYIQRYPIHLTFSFGVGFSCCVLAFFAYQSHAVKSAFADRGGEISVLPYPANPFCFFVIQAKEAKTYQARVFQFSTAPRFFPAKSCPAIIQAETTAHLQPSGDAATAELLPLGMFEGNLAELSQIRQSCYGNAFLRFARIPFWKHNGEKWIIGDLRYDRTNKIGFAKLEVELTKVPCPGGVPPWETPFLTFAGEK